MKVLSVFFLWLYSLFFKVKDESSPTFAHDQLSDDDVIVHSVSGVKDKDGNRIPLFRKLLRKDGSITIERIKRVVSIVTTTKRRRLHRCRRNSRPRCQKSTTVLRNTILRLLRLTTVLRNVANQLRRMISLLHAIRLHRLIQVLRRVIPADVTAAEVAINVSLRRRY
jgi:hypothetical protein